MDVDVPPGQQKKKKEKKKKTLALLTTRQRKRRRADAARLFASVLFQSKCSLLLLMWRNLGKTQLLRHTLFLFKSTRKSRSKKHSRKERERERREDCSFVVVLCAVHVHFVLVVSGVVERREKTTDIRFGKQRGFHHASADCFRYDDDKDKRDDGTTNASGR